MPAPSKAQPHVDQLRARYLQAVIRALPDEDMVRFCDMLRKEIDDASVELAAPPRSRPAPPSSRLDTEMFRVLEQVQRRVYPGAITLPSMLTGGTDMGPLRAKGVQAYGIGPLAEEIDALAHGAHTDDERLGEASLYKFVEFLWQTVIEVSTPR